MSNHFKRLSPYVCEKLTTLFKKLSKRFNKTLNQVNQNHNGSPSNDQSDNRSDAGTDVTSATSATSPDLANDLSIYEEVLRMILEIVNSCLAAQLTQNPNLIYTLLYNRDIFEPFQAHPSFQDIVLNVETILTYFSNRVDIESKDRSLSVTEIYQIIQQSSLQWPSEKVKVCVALSYAEDFIAHARSIFPLTEISRAKVPICWRRPARRVLHSLHLVIGVPLVVDILQRPEYSAVQSASECHLKCVRF